MGKLTCDQCRWVGPEDGATVHPRHGYGVCPRCWRRGYESMPRVMLGPLVEALAPTEPGPLARKSLEDWTDDDWATYERIQRLKAAHESAPVLLKTRVKGVNQLGLGFMRPEFTVKEID